MIWKYILVFLSIVVIVIGILLLPKCESDKPITTTTIDTVVKITPGKVYHDTVKSTVYLRPHDRIIEVPAYILIDSTKHDTIMYEMPAYVSRDTVYFGNDTLMHEHYFPEMCDEYIFKKGPDTSKTIKTTITIQLPATFGQKMEYGLYTGTGGAILGGALGFILGIKMK
jgi:hypothetical protein